jgi:hypothetical protein
MLDPRIAATSVQRFLDADRVGVTADDETAAAAPPSLGKLERGTHEPVARMSDELGCGSDVGHDFNRGTAAA